MGQGLPSWLIQIGSLAGLGLLAFTIVDRVFSGRPIPSIRKTGYNTRDSYLRNPSQHDIWVRKVWIYPGWAGVARDSSHESIIRVVISETFSFFIEPNGSRELPLVFRKGELLDRDSTEFAPFVIWISWRRARSAWMPQIPVLIFSSAKSMRRLNEMK